ncbi:hypothetical protein HAX54_044530 [Datura stramonium]|uniref:Uncharacterized protein n=1 Tax=Datura stramonium TaxID=4076 RepID=A0ABS8RSJ9_DATST|nr:hypothetical protein [Datura stramonium]
MRVRFLVLNFCKRASCHAGSWEQFELEEGFGIGLGIKIRKEDDSHCCSCSIDGCNGVGDSTRFALGRREYEKLPALEDPGHLSSTYVESMVHALVSPISHQGEGVSGERWVGWSRREEGAEQCVYSNGIVTLVRITTRKTQLEVEVLIRDTFPQKFDDYGVFPRGIESFVFFLKKGKGLCIYYKPGT